MPKQCPGKTEVETKETWRRLVVRVEAESWIVNSGAAKDILTDENWKNV